MPSASLTWNTSNAVIENFRTVRMDANALYKADSRQLGDLFSPCSIIRVRVIKVVLSSV